MSNQLFFLEIRCHNRPFPHWLLTVFRWATGKNVFESDHNFILHKKSNYINISFMLFSILDFLQFSLFSWILSKNIFKVILIEDVDSKFQIFLSNL